MANFLSIIPVWCLVVLWIVSVGLGFLAVTGQMYHARKKLVLAFVINVVGVLVAAVGPLCQAVFGNMMKWGTSGLLLAAHTMNKEVMVSLVNTSVKWGVIPGVTISFLVIRARNWRGKILWGAIAAAIIFTLMDTWEYYAEGLSSVVSFSYLINMNILGGLLAGSTMGGCCWTFEQWLTSNPGGVHNYSARISSVLIAATVIALGGVYFGWYFFLDRPLVSVLLQVKSWSKIDLFNWGESFRDVRGNIFLSGEVSGAEISVNSETIKVERFLAAKGARISVKVIQGREAFFDKEMPRLNGQKFKLISPLFVSTGRTDIILKGSEIASVVANGDPVELGVKVSGPAVVSFRKSSSAESDSCSLEVQGISDNQVEENIHFSGRFDVYSKPVSNFPFDISVRARDADRLIYRSKGTDRLFQISPGPGFAQMDALGGLLLLNNCSSVLAGPVRFEWLNASAGEGDVKVGIESYKLNMGDEITLGPGTLESREERGAFFVKGSVMNVVLNGVKLNNSRWGRMSVEIRATLIAALLGALGAMIGFIKHERSNRPEE